MQKIENGNWRQARQFNSFVDCNRGTIGLNALDYPIETLKK